MQKSKTGLKKKAAAALAIIVAVATLMMGGTFAWNAISESALNEARDTGINPGGRLHDDYDGVNKDVYIENFGTLPIYARVKLSEYMEIGSGAGLKAGDAGYAEKTATPFKAGANINDPSTWSVHNSTVSAEDCGLDATDKFHSYWAWSMGGSKIYMPTFNKDKDSLKTDYSGFESWGVSAADYEAQVSDPENGANNDGVGNFLTGKPGSHNQWADGDTKTDTAYYKNSNKSETHTARATSDASVITMDQWVNDFDSAPGAYWVVDTDGWAYWAQAIEPDSATGMLLNGITLTQEMEEDWYYAIFANAELVSTSDMDIIYGGSDLTGSAKDLIEKTWMDGKIIAGGAQYVPISGSQALSVKGYDGKIIWAITPTVAGISIDQNGVVSADKNVALGKQFTVKATAQNNELNSALISCETILPVNKIIFPDDTFRTYMADRVPSSNSYNYFTKAQADAITNINVQGTDVAPNTVEDLTGIEWFTKVNTLYANYCKLTDVNLSQNVELKNLRLSYNQLTKLNLEKNTKLETVYASSNQLTSIDLTKAPSLKTLRLTDNKLTSIDLSNNNGLQEIYINRNQLNDIDVTAKTDLKDFYVGYNNLTQLDVTNNTALVTLYAEDNNLTQINVDNNTALTGLNLEKNQLSNINVSANTGLTYLNLGNNFLSTVNVSSNTLLQNLRIYTNRITEIDLSNNTAITILQAGNNKLTQLDISKTQITSMNNIMLYNNGMESLIIGSHQSVLKNNAHEAPSISSSSNPADHIPNVLLFGNKLGNGSTLQTAAPWGTEFLGITYAA